MITEDEIRELPRLEKLRLMEFLWSDLSSKNGDMDSPSWHGDVLRETADRMRAGGEIPIDFSSAKEILRRERR